MVFLHVQINTSEMTAMPLERRRERKCNERRRIEYDNGHLFLGKRKVPKMY